MRLAVLDAFLYAKDIYTTYGCPLVELDYDFTADIL
jgi:hypothetical protein